ncbi:MAG: hypothetical protein QW568_03195 [Candidatus Anstonellaceae archaeon]
MKFIMSPSRAYLLGLWKGRRTKEGVGVEGHREVCETFLKLCLDEKLCQPDKVKYEEDAIDKCYFYNTALRAWLDSEMEKRDERLKYKNEFAANYFAGVFDAKGGWGDAVTGQKMPYIVGDRVDEVVLLRLGFRVKKERGRIAIISGDFYPWIKPYLRLEISKR